MQAQDTQIVSTIIDRALARNYTISVFDGEACALGLASDKSDILGALETTDEDTLVIRNTERHRIGSIYLVHGNEDGVIVSDYSDNAQIRELVE